jgi:type 1 fimbriae regulatory protein FimB/type 1 fimbriae regulatory protein FimE
MRANLRVVGSENFPEIPKVKKSAGRKSDKDYGRENRKHLTVTEVETLMKAALRNRHGKRDRLMIALAYNHGLRVSELCGKRGLEWSDIDVDAGSITVTRRKGGLGGTQPLDADCHRWLKALDKERTSSLAQVFVTERGSAMTEDAFASQLKAAAERAGIANVHPHSLRHACGHALAEANLPAYKLQSFMGHRKAESTAIYIQAAASQRDDARRILSGKRK